MFLARLSTFEVVVCYSLSNSPPTMVKNSSPISPVSGLSLGLSKAQAFTGKAESAWLSSVRIPPLLQVVPLLAESIYPGPLLSPNKHFLMMISISPVPDVQGAGSPGNS